MGISREIGWSTEANLMYAISRKIDRITQILCCSPTTTTSTTIHITTTTTTTTAFCDCDTIMTVGQYGEIDLYGYAGGEGGYGTLDPDCRNIFNLSWYLGELSLFVLYYDENCCEEIVVYSGSGEGTCVYILETTNPFPAVGETCIIKICNSDCATTTTTSTTGEPIATTTTTTTATPTTTTTTTIFQA
jgi:hypothetical protein